MEEKLIIQAKEGRKHSYAPYSRYFVGAAVEDEKGRIYTGCNIENGSYGATMCAERTAIFKAVSDGAKSIKKIAITAEETMPYPCGLCRQVMSEFCDSDTTVIMECDGKVEIHSFGELMPYGFKL